MLHGHSDRGSANAAAPIPVSCEGPDGSPAEPAQARLTAVRAKGSPRPGRGYGRIWSISRQANCPQKSVSTTRCHGVSQGANGLTFRRQSEQISPRKCRRPELRIYPFRRQRSGNRDVSGRGVHARATQATPTSTIPGCRPPMCQQLSAASAGNLSGNLRCGLFGLPGIPSY